MTFQRRFAIAGLGLTAIGRVPGRTALSLKAEAVRAAVADAGLRLADIDGFIGQADFGTDTGADLPRVLGVAPNFFWTVIAGGTSAISAVIAACGAIASGAATTVVIVSGSTALSQSFKVGAAGARVESTPAAYGAFGPLADFALMAQRHRYEYGTTFEQMGAVAITMRNNAQRRPEAQLFGRPLDLTSYLAAPFVVEPFRRDDCCLVSDGAAALVITTAERARDLPSKPVLIHGAGLGHHLQMAYTKRQYTSFGVATAKRAAFTTAGMALADIDFAELYEPFSIGIIVQLEDYGWCAKGEGGPFVESGAIRLDGRLPVNTGGGQASWGYLQGYTPLSEAVLQLTGRGGGTQLVDKHRCLVTGRGATTGGSMMYSEACLILGDE